MFHYMGWSTSRSADERTIKLGELPWRLKEGIVVAEGVLKEITLPATCEVCGTHRCAGVPSEQVG